MKKFEIVLMWAFLLTLVCSGCMAQQVAPLVDGEVMHLFSGTARWLAEGGDKMVHIFQNSNTGLTIYARPLVDGWAVACTNGQCPPVGYFMNLQTWNGLKEFLTSAAGGFTWLNQMPRVIYNPSITMPIMFVIPITTYKDSSGHIWDTQLPCMSPAICWESDAGNSYWPAGWPTRGMVIDDAIEIESIDAWAEVTP